MLSEFQGHDVSGLAEDMPDDLGMRLRQGDKRAPAPGLDATPAQTWRDGYPYRKREYLVGKRLLQIELQLSVRLSRQRPAIARDAASNAVR